MLCSTNLAKKVCVEGCEGGSRADQIGKAGMKDSGKHISDALLVAACSMHLMVFSRVEGVSRRCGEMWAAATRSVGSGIVAWKLRLPL